MQEKMFECDCGETYDGEAPEECKSCGKMGDFLEIPKELIEDRKQDMEEEFNE